DLEAVIYRVGGGGVVARRIVASVAVGTVGAVVFADAYEAGVRAEQVERTHLAELGRAQVGSGSHAVGPALRVDRQQEILVLQQAVVRAGEEAVAERVVEDETSSGTEREDTGRALLAIAEVGQVPVAGGSRAGGAEREVSGAVDDLRAGGEDEDGA